ncbi:MAG: hypothetical protein HY720_32820 [Planctomycetes bacterium]|nr:hypothetical protein [Planctomycetota bacterium]
MNRAQRLLREGFLKDGCRPRVLSGRPVIEVKLRGDDRDGALGRLVEKYEKAGRHPVVLLGRLFVDWVKPRRRKPAKAKQATAR